jgi:hypothetical protein
MAELFQTSPQNVTLHLKSVYDEGELSEAATCKDYLQVRSERNRSVSRQIKHYRLNAPRRRLPCSQPPRHPVSALGRRAPARIPGEGLHPGTTKNPTSPCAERYFEELLARIGDIRSSEKVFWRKVLEIYATSVDYDPSIEASQLFFKTVQNKKQDALGGQWPHRSRGDRPARGLVPAQHGAVELVRRQATQE